MYQGPIALPTAVSFQNTMTIHLPLLERLNLGQRYALELQIPGWEASSLRNDGLAHEKRIRKTHFSVFWRPSHYLVYADCRV